MIYRCILAIRDIYLLAIVLLVYGCSALSEKKTTDWDRIDYFKIACNGQDVDKNASCKGEDAATEIARGRGGKR